MSKPKFKIGDKVLVIKKNRNELISPWKNKSDSFWRKENYPSMIGKVAEIKKVDTNFFNTISYLTNEIDNWFPECLLVKFEKCDIDNYREV